MKRLFSSVSKNASTLTDKTPTITKFWYNHPVPDNSLKSKITGEPILQDKYNRFHNYLRISLTERCNFKCRYCVYEQDIDYTPKHKLLSEDEFLRLTKLFVRAGVDKIRLSGGDPTIYKGLPRFIREIGQMSEIKTLAMTTNGLLLHKKIDEFYNNGLNALNISLDTFDSNKFEYISQAKGHHLVMKSINRALELGYGSVESKHRLKINCVVMKGVNDNEILDFVEFVRDKPINIRFIEFFSIGNNGWNADKMVSFNEMKEKIEEKYGPLKRKDDHFAETAKNYTLEGIMGNISFITSVSMPFCGTCNRIRLLSDGNFRRCLHDDNMLNLRDIIQKDKTDDLLLEAISQHLKNKKKAHAGMDIISQLQKNGLQMIKIGG
jgi:cyclic pyranopterin phosphate synthase